jgi:methyl-accepting chemotaxis protein
MKNGMAQLIDSILSGLGCRTLNQQFLLSYAIIFLLAAMSGVSLYMSMAIDPNTINVAGRQRMLSQRIAKEAMLVEAKIEQRAVLEKTIKLFERSHNAIVAGDSAQNMKPISNPDILAQMQKVNGLWMTYKNMLLQHIESATPETLRQINK